MKINESKIGVVHFEKIPLEFILSHFQKVVKFAGMRGKFLVPEPQFSHFILKLTLDYVTSG